MSSQLAPEEEDKPEDATNIPAPAEGTQIQELLYKRLVKTHVIEAQAEEPAPVDEMINISGQVAVYYLNGYLFSRYMIALKLLVVSF